MIAPQSTTVATPHGEATYQTIDDGRVTQVNCFAPPNGGAGFYVLLKARANQADQRQAVVNAINAGPHPADTVITDAVPGCIHAASVSMVPGIKSIVAGSKAVMFGGDSGVAGHE